MPGWCSTKLASHPQKIRISGSKAMLAKTTAKGEAKASPSVLSFIREWCTKADEDENWLIIV